MPTNISELDERQLSLILDDFLIEQGWQRKSFVSKVYAMALVYLAVTWAQILPLILIEDVRQFFRGHFYLFFVVVGVFLVVLVIPAITYTVHKRTSFYVFFIILWIELNVITESIWCAIHDTGHVGTTFGISLALVFGLTFVASTCPIDITTETVMLSVVKGFVSLFCFILFLVYIFTKDRIILITFFCLLIFFNSILLIYKSQIIFGGGSLRLNKKDWLYGGFGIYIDFVLMFICILPLLSHEE